MLDTKSPRRAIACSSRTCHGASEPARSAHPRSRASQAQGTTTMAVRAGREFLAIPGPTTMPDEVLRAMHRPALDIYSERDGGADRQPAARSRQAVRHQGQLLHLHRQRPWRLGSRAQQRAVARRQGAGAGERPLRDRLGQCRRRDGRRGRGAEGRLAPRGAARGGRGAPAPRQGAHASRRSSWCRSIPPRASSTTSRRSARRSRPPAIRRCTWSTLSPRSAACRSRWTTGASTSRCPARRRA